MKKSLIAAIFVLSISTKVNCHSLYEIIWMTEEYPPLNYTENGVLKGQFVEILSELWIKAGIDKSTKQIMVLPWARSYSMLQNVEGTALFAISRTKKREKLFKWVGPVNIPPIAIITKKENSYSFKSVADINHILSDKLIGVVRDDSGEHYFLEQGGDPNLLFRVNNGSNLVKMLDKDRVHAIAYLQNVAVYFMKESKIDASKYEITYPLTDGAQGWYAFHMDVEQEAIDTLQIAFEELVSEGVIENIGSRYIQ